MVKMFDRNNFVLSGLSVKQKKQSAVVTISVAVFFILSAFTFMNFLYCVSDCAGSIVCASPDIALRDAIRSVPMILSFFITLCGLMTAQTFYRNESPEKLQKNAKKHILIGMIIGAAMIVFVIYMRICGKYLSLTEGAPSPIYPLDSVIYSAVLIILGMITLSYLKKIAREGRFVSPSRAPVQKKGRFIRSVFRTFWLFVALYGFCGTFYSLFIVDFRHGYLPYSLSVILISFVAFMTLAVWEFYYNNLKEEKKKEMTLPLSLISLAVSAASAVIYFIALKGNLDGPSNVGFGILPVAFAASVNLATLFVVAMPVIVSVAALIKGIFRRRKSGK